MKPILGIDTETTGLTALDRVCQVAAIQVNPITLETVNQFCTLIDPQVAMHPMAYAAHGISPESLVGRPTMDDVWLTSPLAKWIAEADILFGHNVSFDIRMLGKELFTRVSVLDTLPLTRACWPGWPRHKLQHCVANLGLPQHAAHDALGDVESSADILRYLNLNHGHSIDDMIRISREGKGQLQANVFNRLLA